MNNKIVGLFSHNFESDNLGVQALSYANLEIIKKECEKSNVKPEFIVFGTCSSNSTVECNGTLIKVVPVTYKRVLKQILKLNFTTIREIKKLDIAFDIGEGDSFSDIYGLGRLSNVLILKFFAKIFNIPLVNSPQTLGPFKSKASQFLSKICLPSQSVVIARDLKSKEAFEQSIGREVECVSTDVAFSLPFNKQNLFNNKISIGIGISGLLFNGGYNKSNDFNLKFDYADFIRRLIRQNLDKGYSVHLVAHVISDIFEVEDDFRVCEMLSKEFRNDNVFLAPRFTSPIEAKTYISNLSFFFGARMHSVIAAFSAGVPCLPLAYSRKFSGLFSSVKYFHCLELFDVQIIEALKMCAEAVKNRDELKQQVDESCEIAFDKLSIYKNVVLNSISK